MKYTLLATALTLITAGTSAQITISSSDIASAGDTFRISNAQITPAIDPDPTGANFTWDFSFLQPVNQDVDSTLSVSAAGPTYAFFFADLSINSNRSNQSRKGDLALPNIPLGGGVTISDVYNFYYKNSTEFRQTGIGATINGLGVPIAFNNKDVIYRFPMNFGDTDTSFSDYSISIPNLGYYGHDQVRISEVDGWGTLITPYGSFNTLRIKSEITGNDTLYADSLGFGFSFPSQAITEYKWLAEQSGIPILQINATQGFFGSTITSVVYRDSIRYTNISDEPGDANAANMNIFPNPGNGYFEIELGLASTEDMIISAYSAEGRKTAEIFKGKLVAGSSKLTFNTRSLGLASGYYLIEARFRDNRIIKKLIVTGN
jgi:hypothetical protein